MIFLDKSYFQHLIVVDHTLLWFQIYSSWLVEKDDENYNAAKCITNHYGT